MSRNGAIKTEVKKIKVLASQRKAELGVKKLYNPVVMSPVEALENFRKFNRIVAMPQKSKYETSFECGANFSQVVES